MMKDPAELRQKRGAQNRKNRRAGFRFERYRLGKVKKAGGYGFRAYASKGLFDIVYIDSQGIGHLEQLKFSSVGKPRISKDERVELQRFAENFRGLPCHVSIVLKQAYQKEQVIRLN